MSIVVAMPWEHVSASQLDTYLSCNRKWWLDKIGADSVRTESASQSLGKEVHSNIEKHLLGTGPLDHPLLTFNTFASSVKSRLASSPNVEILVEHEFHVPGDRELMGFIDLVIVDHDARTVEIWDHKTTKDWKYAKTAEELRVNPQGSFYAHVMSLKFGPDYSYSFGHHVILTTKPQPERLVQVDFTPSMIRLAGANIAMLIRAMIQTSELEDGREVSPTYSSCFKYGRCTYYAKCKGNEPMPSLTLSVPTPTPEATRRLYPEEVYVDCVPFSKPYTNFAVWTEGLEAEFKADVGKDAMTLKYAEGVIAIAAKARDLLDAPRFLFIRTSDAAGMKYLDLVETKTSVVQSVR